MRLPLRSVAIGLLSVASVAHAEGEPAPVQSVDAGRPSVLIGEVRSMGTRRPLAAAQVSIDGGAVLETSADGRFLVEASAGPVELTVSASGFRQRTFVETLEAGQRLEVLYRLEPNAIATYETVVRARQETEAPRVELGRTELTETAGTQGDPFRAVMLLPGVGSVASGLSYPVVRGTQPAATGFFLDGVRVPQLYHLLAGPSVFAPDFIERVDFFTGALPARYGRLLGGAVEAKLARPPESLKATVSIDLLSAQAYIAAPIRAANLNVAVGGRFSYTALVATEVAKVAFPSTPAMPQPAPVANFQDYQARIEWNPGPGKLRLLVFGAADEAGIRERGPGTTTALLSNVFHRADLSWRMGLGGGQAEAGVTVGTDQLGLIGSKGGRDIAQFLMRRTSWQGRLRYSRSFSESLTFEATADVDRQNVSLEIDRDPVIAIGSASSLREPQTLGTMASTSVELAWKSGPFALSGGLRGDLFTLDTGLLRWSLDPRVSARMNVGESLLLRGSMGLTHQAPTVMLNVPVSDLAGLREGLQAGARFDLGADARLSSLGLDASASVFFNPLFPAVEYSLESLLTNRARVGESTGGLPGRAYGLELMVRKKAEGRWFGWVSYTLLRSERFKRALQFDARGNVVDDVTGWVPFDFDQTHVLHVTGGLTLPKGWKLSASAHVNSGRPESGNISSRAQEASFDPVAVVPSWVPVSLARDPRLPPFARLDARVSKTWTFDDFLLEGYLDVLNASVSSEVLGYTYDTVIDSTGQTRLRKTPFAIPLVLPTIGVKGSY